MGYAGIKRDRPSQLTQAISTAYPPLGNNFHQHPPLSREHKGGGKKPLKRRGEFLGAGQSAVRVHPWIGDRQKFRDGVVADRPRIALVSRALEKIRGRYLLAHRL